MFGSSIIDVVVGVVFLFLGVSLATSAITEAIASAMKLRHATLLQGIKNLLNDRQFTGLAKELYSHALVNPLTDGKSAELTATPAYISGRNFALALHDVLQSKAPEQPIEKTIQQVADRQIQQTLLTLYKSANNDVAEFQARVATWFDTAMDRVSGVYKRRTQVISFVVALLISVLLNADALRITAALWARPALTESLTSALAGGRSGGPSIQDAIAQLDAVALIGWTQWHLDPKAPTVALAMMLVGWVISAAAALFGAPFWFDVLQRFASIRGVGKAPAPAESGPQK